MKIDFDFKKLKDNKNFSVRKEELNKFLNFYFLNGRPKSFVKYVDDLFYVSPDIMNSLTLNDLLKIVPNLYQFFYTITLNDFYADSQNKIAKNLLFPFSKILSKSLFESNLKNIIYKTQENHFLVVCRHAFTQGMYAPGTVIYSLTAALLKSKKNVILITLGKVDNKFLNLQKNNSNLSIMTPDKNSTPLIQFINLIEICKKFRPNKIITEMPVNIVTALYYSNVSSKILYWCPGFTQVPWFDKVMLVPELINQDSLKDKKNILVPRSIDFNLLNPKISNDLVENFKKNNDICFDNFVLGTFARYDKITLTYLKLVSFILQKNQSRKIIIAGSNDNTEAKEYLKKFIKNKQAIILGQSNVHIIGNSCNVFLDTIPFPCGSSAIEMMAKGKPVLGIKKENLASYDKSRIKSLMVEDKFLLNELLIKLEKNDNFYNKMSKDSIKIAKSWDNSLQLVKKIEEV